MAALSYVGRAPDSDGIIVPKSYTDSTNAAQALTTTWVNNQIASATALLTNQSYVDLADAAVAHKTAVTAADTAYAAATLRGATSGVASLDSAGSLLTAALPSGIPTDRIAQCYSLAPAVAFEAVGTPLLQFGASSNSGANTVIGTGSHTSGGGSTTVVLAYVDTIPNGSSVGIPTGSVTYGGQPMTLLGSPVTQTFPGNASAYGAVFYLFNPPPGAQTVQSTLTATGVASGGWFTTVQTVSYTNVGSLGTLMTNKDFSGNTSSATLNSIPCSTKGLISVGFGHSSGTGSTQFSTTTSTARWRNDTASVGLYFIVGEYGATGASSYNAQATLGANGGWGVLAVPLNPGGSGTQIGALNISAPTTVTGTTVQKLASIVVPDPGWPWRAIPLAWVAGDSSGATNPNNRALGTGSYGVLTVVPPGGGQNYGLGLCTGSFFTDLYTLLPYAAAGQTPTSVPPITGSLELDLCGQLWSGTTYTFYPTGLQYFVMVVPAL